MNRQVHELYLPEGVTEADVTGADPPEKNIAVPLGVAGGDGGLPVGVALNINESALIVEQGSSNSLDNQIYPGYPLENPEKNLLSLLVLFIF